MENTHHVMLSGSGALKFALENGFKKEDLHTEFSRKKWEEWKEKQISVPVNRNNHDTISMLAIDQKGNLSGACTTSGTAYKMHGRVGDSPIIGAGLYVNNDVGAAAATGVGEVAIKTVGSHRVVENMRHGYAPQDAIEEVINYTLKKVAHAEDLPIYYIAINKHGEYGAFGTRKGFEYALRTVYDANQLKVANGAL
jgi:isoaspartyl peptidase/L-asparaginase-like protein (Ntn-hydrolase superfamily)